MSPLLLLNATALRNRVAELGLRQWWLAEQLGVDRRTVLRWINGQVRSIPPERARDLAQVLGCRLEDLLLHEAGRELASEQDQRAAGLALATSTLLDRLGPVGEWDVIEQLIKASAVPDLPVHVLGRLHHQLSVACWRQDKLAEAATHNQAALALADRCGDQALRADALGSQANLLFWRGEVAPALAAWGQALALAPWLTPRQRGALHCNLGAALLETGALAEGRAELQLALACFEIEGTPMNFSVLHGHLALAALAEGDLANASLHAQRSQAQARSGDYARGLAFAPLLLAVVAAHRGQAEEAREGLAASQAAFARLSLDESLNHRLAAEIWRHLGQTEAARQAAHQALARAEGFPLEKAAAAAELARVEAQALSPPVTGQTVPAPLR